MFDPERLVVSNPLWKQGLKSAMQGMASSIPTGGSPMGGMTGGSAAMGSPNQAALEQALQMLAQILKKQMGGNTISSIGPQGY